MLAQSFSALALLAVFLIFSASAQQCTVNLQSVRQATWVDGQVQPRSLWTVTIMAPVTVSNVFVNIEGPIQQIWEMVQVDNSNVYRLPDWRIQIGGISAGQSHVFGFIINNNATESPVTLNRAVCPGSPSPTIVASPPVSPSPSVSPPASPSPSPSGSPGASASASPSGSPQASASPSGSPGASASASPTRSPGVCSVEVTQTARSSNQGGSWTQDGFRFQIFDLNVTNTGTQPLRSVRINLNLASDQEIPADQFWNLVRVDRDTFDVAPMVLPSPGGSNTSIGYILRTPVSSSSGASSIASAVATC